MRDRALFAEGHVRFREDVPWMPRARLTEARWVELENAAGSVAATAEDMVAYLSTLLQLAGGSGRPLSPTRRKAFRHGHHRRRHARSALRQRSSALTGR
jgi:hypothetical protein